MQVQWFPGHMAKAIKTTKERMKMVDMVIEVCDARIPDSSRNPVLDEIIGDKKRLLLLNKADLADEAVTEKWIEYLKEKGVPSLAVCGTNRKDAMKIVKKCKEICSEKIESAKAKGQIIRPVRVMVAGIPNTGKSSIINAIAGKKSAVTSDRPGVTRSPQWIRSADGMELMDMPGILWPKIDSEHSQALLAATGAIKDSIIDIEEIAYIAMGVMFVSYPNLLKERYKLDLPGKYDQEVFYKAALKRGCVRSGGKPDTERFANIFLDELRAGKPGKMTFEMPEGKT